VALAGRFGGYRYSKRHGGVGLIGIILISRRPAAYETALIRQTERT
jgi:hypothetical protein